MSKKYIASVLIHALLIQLYGCYSMQDIPKDEMAGLKGEGDLILYAKDSTMYFFEDSNYHISNDSLYGKGYIKFNDNSDLKVPIENTIALKNIKMAERDELNPVTTTLLITGILIITAGAAYFIGLAIALSGR